MKMKPNEVVKILKEYLSDAEIHRQAYPQEKYFQLDIEALTESIRCVEGKEQLEREVTNLKYKLDYISEVAMQEKEQFMKALRKCSPWDNERFNEVCLFCKSENWVTKKHKDNCEYVRLTGGAE
jgi:hypothetical protein